MQDCLQMDELLPLLKLHRRELHKIPEEGFSEFETHQYLMKALAACHPDVIEPMLGTGIKVCFYGSGNRTIAFRSDIDALCIKEENDIDFVSQNVGFMHACGHDGHMATLLVLAKLLDENRQNLVDTVVLIFQPAEESTGGADPLIQAGVLDNPHVDEIYAMHLMPELPIGTIGSLAGALMAQTCELDIIIKGKTAHGAMPHKGIDAVAAAAHLYTLLQTSIARCIDPYQCALLTVGKLTAGVRRNIIADNAMLECTARTFSDDVYAVLRKHMLADISGIEASFGAKIELIERTYYPPVVNPKVLVDKIAAIAGDSYVTATPLMIAEDFSYYQRHVSGAYFFCGCGDDEYTMPIHSSSFNFDEAALLNGLNVFFHLICIK